MIYACFSEEKMVMAVLRICPGCKRALIKVAGCKHVHCPCGEDLCFACGKNYVCREF